MYCDDAVDGPWYQAFQRILKKWRLRRVNQVAVLQVHAQPVFNPAIFDENEFVAQTRGLMGMFENDDVREFWRANKSAFSAEFRAYVDDIAASPSVSE